MPLAPEYEAMFAQLAEAAQAQPTPPLWEMTPEQGREMYRAMRPVNPDIPIHDVRDTHIEGSQGSIPVRIYTPTGEGPFGVLVYFHGGGWVIGDLDTCDAVCRDLANTANLVIVSVDYRMAPEHPYPAAVIDSFDATQWAANNMSTLNGNGKLGVAGESAGGESLGCRQPESTRCGRAKD